MSKVGQMICEYDESNAIDKEVEYRIENWKEFSYEEKPDEEKVRNDVYDDTLFFEMYNENITGYLTDILQKKNKSGYWRAEVKNFGWRNQDGSNVFEITTGEELVHQILPKCECRWKLYNYGKGIAIQNWHHDSPMGNEWYYLVPMSREAYYKAKE